MLRYTAFLKENSLLHRLKRWNKFKQKCLRRWVAKAKWDQRDHAPRTSSIFFQFTIFWVVADDGYKTTFYDKFKTWFSHISDPFQKWTPTNRQEAIKLFRRRTASFKTIGGQIKIVMAVWNFTNQEVSVWKMSFWMKELTNQHTKCSKFFKCFKKPF